MFDCVLIDATCESLTAPLIVRDLFVAHILAKNATEGFDDVSQRVDGTDQRVGRAGWHLKTCEETRGDTCRVLGRNERDHRLVATPRKPDRSLSSKAGDSKGAEVLVKQCSPDMCRPNRSPI